MGWSSFDDQPILFLLVLSKRECAYLHLHLVEM